MFPEDINTSGSWDLIDPRCDTEVADITGEQNQQPVNQTMNTSYDSTQANPNQGLPQVNQVSLNQHLGTLYNQDFFVTDTAGRRLSQIPDKSSYPYLLPNGHSVLQLRLPDLLIYLKMDTYLIDVHTGHNYAVYSNHIEKMSIPLSCIQHGDTSSYYKPFKMMPCVLVSLHLNPQPAKHLMVRNQPQVRG